MAFDYAPFGEIAGPVLKANGVKLGKAMAAGMRPSPRISVADWAAEYRRFPDDGPYPGKWRHETAPYLVEIMDALSVHDPCEEVDIIKCAQSGGTAAIENWIGYVSDVAPGPGMYVQATFNAALAWASEKLWPMVEATPRLNPTLGGTIRPQKSPDGRGSTASKLVFKRGGFLLLAGANSAPSLRQRTVRYAVEDDLDQFVDDLDKQGSPESMVDQRLKVYRRQGLSKRAKISTPLIKGSSKIDAAYQASDRRRFYLKCPHCADRFDPRWEDVRWPDGNPAEAVMVPPCCSAEVEHYQKAAMSLADGWVSVEIDGATAPRVMSEADFQAWRARMPQSRRRGFHIGGLITAFATWSDLAVGFVAAQGDVNKLKTWTNLDLGDVFELKGGAPDFEKLQALREQDWGRDQMPVGPVVQTLGCDVQGDGIYGERVGMAENAETWSLDQFFLPGATDVPGEGAWISLEAYARRRFAFPGGKALPIDQICVDAGYHTEAAEAFCRGHANRLPVFGRAGWRLPVLGRGENIRFHQQGKRTGQASKRAEDKAYLVGTYGVKLTVYGYFRTTIEAAEEARKTGVEPPAGRGRQHFGRDAPDQWFEQVTSEHIVVKVVNGFPRREWQPMPGRQNHWLDCRVYNHAAAEKLMLDTLGEADWAALRAERYAAPDPAQGDLLALAARPAPPPSEPSPAPSSGDGAFVDVGDDYLR